MCNANTQGEGQLEGRWGLDLSDLAGGLMFHFLSQEYACYFTCLRSCGEEALVDLCVT